MKKLFIFFVFCSLSMLSIADDFPEKSNTLVTDYTQLLSPSEIQTLESKLVAFNDSTSTQIAVVIIRSTGGYNINDYTAQLGNKWGIGKKQKNNGILILVAKEDRKVSIQVGYGLEAVVTDALSKRIIEKEIRPNFKQGNYFEGLERATDVIISLTKGEFTADEYAKNEQGIPWFFFLIFGLIFLIVIFHKAKSVNQYASTNNLSFWAAWALMNAASNRSSGSWGNFSSGSGNFGGGSSFGGFGGGSFGGGGASGSW